MKKILLFGLFLLLFCFSCFGFYKLYTNGENIVNTEDKELKYIFLVIGDGFAQSQDEFLNMLANEEYVLDKIYNKNLLTTNSLDNSITDSAAAGTAIATGSKTNNGIIGMSPEGLIYANIFDVAKENNYTTALLTNMEITHATPSSFYAHNISRSNEEEIMEDLIISDINLIIGGGLKYYIDNSFEDLGYTVLKGIDGYYNFINKDYENNNKLIGLFSNSHSLYEPKNEFDLSNEVEASIDFLGEDNKFVFVIESGNIDKAGHLNDMDLYVNELYEFNDVLDVIYSFYLTHMDETLLLITGDHETGDLTVDKNAFKILNNNPFEIDGIIFNSTYHTSQKVPLYYTGNSYEYFKDATDNTDIGNTLIELMAK